MIVLDTHVLIWWLAGGKLSSKAQKIINKFAGKERSILVSSISAWEMAMLVDHGRLVLTMDVETWLETAKKIPSIQFVPIDNSIAIQSTRLPGDFHRDPADRMLVALARHWSAPIVTADEKILAYRYVKAVW